MPSRTLLGPGAGGQLCEGSSLASRGSILLSMVAMLGELELSTPIHANASRVPDRTTEIAPSCADPTPRSPTGAPWISQRLDAESRLGAAPSFTAVYLVVAPPCEVLVHEQLFVLETKLAYAWVATAIVGNDSTTSSSCAPAGSDMLTAVDCNGSAGSWKQGFSVDCGLTTEDCQEPPAACPISELVRRAWLRSTVSNRGTCGDHVVAPAGHDGMTLGVV